MLATAKLIKKLGGEIIECTCIVDLPDLKGSKKLKEAGLNFYAQTFFEGE